MRECLYEDAELTGSRCAALGGFSLHADTACEVGDREKIERLGRYVARAAIAMDRLSRRVDGLLVYKLKKRYKDGTQYLLFSPEELLEKLAALVPIPRARRSEKISQVDFRYPCRGAVRVRPPAVWREPPLQFFTCILKKKRPRLQDRFLMEFKIFLFFSVAQDPHPCHRHRDREITARPG